MMKKRYKTIILVTLLTVLTILPILIVKNSEFSGADEKAEEEIEKINPNYKRWFKNLWSPPGSETETLIFSLEAAAGGIVIGYIIGYFKGRGKK